jgi:AcrR family transcriptional regulator
MVRKADIPKAVVAAALELAVEQGWRRVSLHGIAERAGVPLADLYQRFSSKQAVLSAFVRGIDEEVLRGLDPEDAAEGPRDRLFAVLMRRFDALAPHKKAVGAILCDACADPLTLACGACRYLRSMAWMLEAAGISTAGIRGLIRVKGLCALYLPVLAVWLEDDTPDMAKTMAALDRWLRRAEWLELCVSCLPAPRREAAEGREAPQRGPERGAPSPA